MNAGQLLGLGPLVIGSPRRGFRPTEGIAKLLDGSPKSHLTGLRVATLGARIVLETIAAGALRFLADKGVTLPARWPNRSKRKVAGW